VNLGLGVIGRQETMEEPTADAIRALRVQQARERTRWQEIPEERLVRRDPWWVDAETDELLTLHRGDVFNRVGLVVFDENRDDLRFTVRTSDGEVVILEPSQIARTWSDFVYQRERGAARARR
jgi:hypothetical protein